MIVKKSFNCSSRSILFFTLLLLFGLAFISGCSKDSNNSPEIEGTVDPEDPEDPEDTEDTEDPVTESTEPVGPSILRINSGGEELTFDSVVFEEDKYFTGDVVSFVNHVVTEIENTEMDELYLSSISHTDNVVTFGYAIPVTNGTYTVKFYFAEIVWGAINDPDFPGEENRRIFSVDVEGHNTIKNFDIYKEVGSITAITKMYDVEVSDGELTISFNASADRATVCALEIFGDGEIVID